MLGDRNGDGVNELSALIGSGDDREKRPAILDGANGNVLWSGASAGTANEVYLLCVGGRWIGILDDQSFALRLLAADAPEREVRHILSDEVFYFGADDQCIHFRTDDGRRTGFEQSDGSETSHCRAVLDRRPHIEFTTKNGIISTLRAGARAEHGEMRYHLTARRPGTPFLQVSAHRGRRELWDIPLRLVPVDGEAIGTLAVVAAPDVVVVFGAERGRDSRGFTAVGLNAESGTERFATPLRGWSLGEIYYNERYVIVGMMHRVVALEVASGEVAWGFPPEPR